MPVMGMEKKSLPGRLQGKDFLYYRQEGGELQLAFTKEEKTKIMEQYEAWLTRSQAVYLLQYSKMSMKEVDYRARQGP